MGTNQSRAHFRRFSISLALAAAALLLPREASAFACLWDGSSSTSWAAAANWSTCNATIPQTGDTVTINSGGNQPSLATAATVQQVTVNSGATLTVASGGALTLSNGLTGSGNLTVLSGGTLNWNAGLMDGVGTTAIHSGATLNMANSYGTLQRTMTNAGTANLSAGGYVYILTGGTFSNSGTVNLQGNSYAFYGGATTTLTNTGTFHKTLGSGTATIYNLTFVNSGTVSVETGTLDLQVTGSATHSGSFAVSAGATLQFSSNGNNAINGAITGAGAVNFAGNGTQTLTSTFSPGSTTISGGNVNFNQGSTQNLANLTLTSGTLAGSAAINITGNADLNSGTLGGNASFTFANGTTSTLDSSYLTVTRPIVNAGTINLLSNAYFYFQAGGSFTNQSTGVLDIQHNYYGLYGDGNTPINNTGTIKRTTSSGTATLYNIKLVNTSPGAVSVQTGTLDIQIPGAVSHTGPFSVSSGAILKFSGSGTATFTGTINGAGAVVFSGGGGTNLNGTYAISDTTISGGTVNFNHSPQTLTNLTMTSGTLAGSAAVTVTGLTDLNSGTLAGSGTFTLANSADVTLDSSYINIQRPFINQAHVIMLGSAYFYITGGSLTNQADGVIEIQNNSYGIYGSAQQNFANAGTVLRTTSSGTSTVYYLNITNTGTWDIQSGVLSIQSCNFTQTAGAVHLNGGNLEVSGSPGVLNIQGGVFDGNGTINGNISVSGTGQFNPGTSPGEISITNSHTYTQAAPGVLNVDVNGTQAGFDYDRLLISGAATLGGELKVNLGYTPALGDSFTILEHASRTGTFTKLTFPSPGAGRGWDLSYTATATKLTIAELAGAFLVVDGHAGTGTSSDTNGVLEPGERVVIEPNWLNMTDSAIASSGTASNISGPAGATYALNDTTAAYGTAAPNSTDSCYTATGDCFQASVSDPASRPAVHWDASFKETLTGGSSRTWMLHVGDSFTDVPRGQPFYAKIETLLHTGITAGCTTTTYCPSGTVSRGAMAIFVAKGLAGGGPNIPSSGSVSGTPYNCVAGASGVSLFTDVAPTDIFCKQVHYIAAQNVTGGCSGTTYCPNGTITRLEMAAFIAKAIVAPAGGAAIPLSYTDPITNLSYNCNGSNIHFTDVPANNVFCKHVHFLWAKGIIGGISPTLYGPGQNVTRDGMAKFLSNAFNLLLYGPVP